MPTSAQQIEAIRVNLDQMEEYVNFLEKYLQNAVNQVESSIEEQGKQKLLAEELWNAKEIYPCLFRASALLSILGFFEHNLNVVCETLRKEFGKETKVTDLPGKGLKRSKLYISKKIGVDFPANSESWNRLLKLSDVRNLIAHRDSQIKDNNPDLVRFIKENQYMSIDLTNRVRLHKGALNYLVNYLHEFFKELAERICIFSDYKSLEGKIIK